ncbi:hypothetical protein [Clostridium beijerinckii]|uniref:hypothetical protein n=1 Tax=Clostridium beijerinckii TaxID=1520 RepID=UPI00098CBFCB|nr:hypothetical protein [Clostridium beijerinckii]MBA8935636.1 hypothetical protein [Clostridium beijerinckii]NRU40030.1 hypothetical protein [Clostridium beijerinckii]NSA96692.1 hypothetical protein [Clostridium beijerinckii]OOM61216.1 hypothetical protein CLOBI_27170 [Clostridium beijerinckii]OOM71736.1 hypothetical protein CLBEIC_11500 [Clostridium beijerinckii]
MDIENLKRECVKDKSEKEYIENVKRTAMVLLKQLIDLDKEIWEECSNICHIYRANIKKEFCNYFIKNGFEIRQGTEIIAKYECLEIKLLKLAEDSKYEAKYILTIGGDKEFYIKLRPSNKCKKIISWNYPLFNNDEANISKENGKKVIAACSDLEKLKKASEFFKKKIEEFNEILSDINLFRYIYTEYEKGKTTDDKVEFDTFEELFRAL